MSDIRNSISETSKVKGTLDKKISEVFLDFIEPVLSEMGCPVPGSKEFDDALKVGWTIWNAVVKADVDGDRSFLDSLSVLVPKPYSVLTDFLVERKRNKYSSYTYLLGNYETRKKPDGSFSLFAEARESSAYKEQ